MLDRRRAGARRTGRQPGRQQGRRPAWLALVNRWRVAGFLLAAGAATWGTWLVSSHAFDLDPSRVRLSELVYTSPDVIRDVIGLPAAATPNVFRIQTRRMERDLAALAAVADADVTVTLPDRLEIAIIERTPAFVVATGGAAFVVDVDGFVLDEVPLSDGAMLGLPVVSDARERFAPDLSVGARLDQISLDAALRLLSLRPEDIGSEFDWLTLGVDDAEGYVLTAGPDGWRAVFGHYTPTLRPVEMIDRQVQCLRSRIAAGEDDLAALYLSPQGEACGTYLPRRTPQSPAPDASVAPTRRP